MTLHGRGLEVWAAALLLFWPTLASAQLAPIGGAIPAPAGGSAYARTADVAYDGTNDVFLMATSEHQTGSVFGSFVDSNGTSLGAGFRIDTSGTFPERPAIAYSAEADLFLVAWVNEVGQVRARAVRYGANALGSADVLLGSGARNTWAPAVAYSPSAQEFLVAWSSTSGPGWVQRVSTALSTIGGPLQVTGNVWSQEPALAWNGASGEFLLTYAQELSVGWELRAVRIAGGQPTGGPYTVHSSGNIKMPDVQYSTQSGKYLVSWFQSSPYGIYGRLLNADGTAAASAQPLLPSNFGSYDANSLAYNEYSGTFVVASITPQNGKDTVGGAEVSSGGVPSTSMRFVDSDTTNRWYPKIAGSSANGRFLTIFNKGQSSFFGQMVHTDTSGGGGGTPPPPPPPPSPSLTVQRTAAKADFNADFKADLLWRRSDGALALWRMNGLVAAEQISLNPSGVSPVWRVAGTGDLDGDGKPEIVWQHENDGWLCAWFMNGETLLQAVYLNPRQITSNLWKIVAVGDMNADGKADLIWQHEHGWLAVWYMNGVQVASDGYLTPNNIAGNDWKITGVGDVNGDAKPDLIWQHQSGGWLSAWLMNGSTMADAVYLTPNRIAGSDWKIRGVIDINGDGQTDLIWQHLSGGWVAAWLLQGTTAVDTPYLTPNAVSPSWTLVGPR